MNELDIKIFQELEEKPKDEAVFSEDSFRITRGAFEKAKLYAKLCSKIAGTGMECYGYLMSPKDSKDNTITDVYFADEQMVQNSYVRTTEEAVYSATRNIDAAGCKIVGWWHSHGNLSPFHSGTDDRNFRNILQSVSPLTMYLQKEVSYVIDEENKEVIVDNIRLVGADIKSFKESKPVIIKKEEIDPYALSMVVNMRGEYYLERISKTYNNKRKQYEINEPARPKFEVTDVDNDLEFLVSAIEKDIHKKILFPGVSGNFSQASPDWETNPVNRVRNGTSYTESPEVISKKRFIEQYRKIVDEFVLSSGEYLSMDKGGLVESLISEFLTAEPAAYRYDMLRDGPKKEMTKEEIKTVVDSLISDRKKIVDNILSAMSDTDAHKYVKDDNKLDINETRNLVNLQFMIDVIQKHRKFRAGQRGAAEQEEYARKVDESVKDGSMRAAALAESFSTAVNATKAMTYYAMESLTDYKNEKGHLYKNLVRRVLDNISGEKNFSLSESINLELRYGNKKNKAKEFFLYTERFNIVNQLTKDLYNHKLVTLKGNDVESMKPAAIKHRKLMESVIGFNDTYTQEGKGKRKVDELIEKNVLLPWLVSNDSFRQYQDGKKHLRNYTEEDKRIADSQSRKWSRWNYPETEDDTRGYKQSIYVPKIPAPIISGKKDYGHVTPIKINDKRHKDKGNERDWKSKGIFFWTRRK